MKLAHRCLESFLVLVLAACASNAAKDGEKPTPAADASAPAAAQAPAAGAQSGAFEKTGILAPSEYAPVAIWPEVFSGALLALEVKPHGSAVQQGDVITKLETTAIDDEIHRAELETHSATIRHEGLSERNRLDAQAAKTQLDLAKSSAARAQRTLDGWKKFELDFTKRSEDIGRRYEVANVEDQVDELDQLEKMYKNDTLVSATEDIVIKRSKRQLALTKDSNQLSDERKRYRQDFDLSMQTEQKEEQARTQNEALARLTLQLELDARARQDAELRSADALREQTERLDKLRRDRERLVLRAPRAGVLLHGASKDYRPGRTPARYDRGSQLAFRQELFLIAEPHPAAVALDLNDAELSKLSSGAGVDVQTIGASPLSGHGSVHVDVYPRSSNANEATYEANVALDAPLSGAVYGSRAKVTVAGKPQG